jgi:hypothetical protein
VFEIAPEIAAENRLANPGDEIEVHVIASACNLCRWWLRRECPRPSTVSCAAS